MTPTRRPDAPTVCPVDGCTSTDYPHDPDDHGHPNPCGCDWTGPCEPHRLALLWDAGDTEELREAMADAADARRGDWTAARAMAGLYVRDRVADAYRADPTPDPLTPTGHPGTHAAIRAAAALYGLVPDPADPHALVRFGNLGWLWAPVIRARAIVDGNADPRASTWTAARWYESADGFEEYDRLRARTDRPATDAHLLPPIYAAGLDRDAR